MNITQRTIAILGSSLLSLLLAIGLQFLFYALFTFRCIDFYNFNGVQAAVEIVYLAIAVIIGTGMQITADEDYIYINRNVSSVAQTNRELNADLETALGYIALLEDHIKYNDDFHNDNYIEYSQTELELQIREFRTKKKIINLIKDGINPQSRI